MKRVINQVTIAPPVFEREPVPDLDGLRQTDIPPVAALAVKTEGVTTTQELPATHSTSRSITLTNSPVDGAQQLMNKDARRKALTLWCETNGVYFCEDKAGITGTSPYGAHLPAGGSYTINHQNAVWTVGDNPASTLLSFVLEQWAD